MHSGILIFPVHIDSHASTASLATLSKRNLLGIVTCGFVPRFRRHRGLTPFSYEPREEPPTMGQR